MMKLFLETALNNNADKNNRTIQKIIFFMICLFSFLIVTSIFFPIKAIHNKYLALIEIEVILDVTLIVWYCSIFLFLVSICASILLFVICYILDKIEKTPSSIRNKLEALYQTAHVSYINVFNYLVCTSFVLLFISPDILLLSFNDFLYSCNIILYIFGFLQF